MSLCLCLCDSVSLCLCLCLSVSLCLSLSLCLSVCLSLSLSLSLSRARARARARSISLTLSLRCLFIFVYNVCDKVGWVVDTFLELWKNLHITISIVVFLLLLLFFFFFFFFLISVTPAWRVFSYPSLLLSEPPPPPTPPPWQTQTSPQHHASESLFATLTKLVIWGLGIQYRYFMPCVFHTSGYIFTDVRDFPEVEISTVDCDFHSLSCAATLVLSTKKEKLVLFFNVKSSIRAGYIRAGERTWTRKLYFTRIVV